MSVNDRNLFKNIIYPNPADNDISSQKPLKNVIIYDLAGREIPKLNNSRYQN